MCPFQPSKQAHQGRIKDKGMRWINKALTKDFLESHEGSRKTRKLSEQLSFPMYKETPEGEQFSDI